MRKSGVLHVGWSLAANDEGRPSEAGREAAATPEMVALICASRMDGGGFRILSAPGCAVPVARDAHGVFHFARGQARA